MSSVVENQTELTGRVRSREPHPSNAGWDVLRIVVADAGEVEGMPNLMSESIGREVAVAVERDELPEGDLHGYRFTGRVRVAGPEVVLALPAGSGAPPRELVPPQEDGDPIDAAEDHPEDPDAERDIGTPAPPGQWPAGDEGPRPVL